MEMYHSGDMYHIGDPDLGRRPLRSKRLKWILGGETPEISKLALPEEK